MGITLLVVGLAGLGLLLLKGSGSGASTYAGAFTKRSDGRLVYKPAVRDIVVNQLLAKYFEEDVENPLDMAQITQLTNMAPMENSAYWALNVLHQAGRDIWVPQTYWLPTKEGVKTRVWFGMQLPPVSLGYALLIAGTDQWPNLTAIMPAPPTTSPPIPSM